MICSNDGLAVQVGLKWPRGSNGKLACRKARVFHQLQRLILRVRALGIEDQDTKRIARPAVVLQEALQVGFLDLSLFMQRHTWLGFRDRSLAETRMVGFGPALQGIHESRGRWAKVQGRKRAAVRWLHERLVFRSREQ